MFITQFKLRSLFLVMTIAAIFANPIYDYSVSVLRSWNQPDKKTITIKTAVTVPDGGYVFMGGLPPRYVSKKQQAKAAFWAQPWTDSLVDALSWLEYYYR